MENKSGKVNCPKCGVSISATQKFCGNCGAVREVSEGNNLENQTQGVNEPIGEQAQGQTLWQASNQTSEQFSGQTYGQTSEQFSGQTFGQTPEQFSGQTFGQTPEQFSGQTFGQTPELFPEQTVSQATEQFPNQPLDNPPVKKKPIAVIVGLVAIPVVLVIALIVGIFFIFGPNATDRMRSQLEELNPTSYSDIREWLDEEFDEDFADDFGLIIDAIDTSDRLLDNEFLDEEGRFVEWSFLIDEVSNELLIEVIYEELIGWLASGLGEVDRHSLRDILEWIEQVEAEHGQDVFIWVRNISVDGDLLSDMGDLEYEELFEEWSFDYSGGFMGTIEIELVFNTKMTFHFGDTFEFDGLEMAFEGEIRWGIDDNEWSSNFREEFFKVPVTITNISDSTINSFFPRMYAPDGTQIDSIFISGADDDITMMGGLRPGATQSGYIYIRFSEDGDYALEFRSWPLELEVIVPINSSDFQSERDGLIASIDPERLRDWDFEPVDEEDLIGRWVEGLAFGAPLFVFGFAETIEFREDGTLLIIEDGVERTENWEMDSDGNLSVSNRTFLVVVEDDVLILFDEWDDAKGWVRA
jgi:hypothetical protein